MQARVDTGVGWLDGKTAIVTAAAQVGSTVAVRHVGRVAPRLATVGATLWC